LPADSIRLVTGFLVRIENELHEELVDRCNKIGCRINDFVKASIEFTLHDHVEFDFGNDDGNKEEQPEQKAYYITNDNVCCKGLLKRKSIATSYES
jgi:hypothetical protein